MDENIYWLTVNSFLSLHFLTFKCTILQLEMISKTALNIIRDNFFDNVDNLLLRAGFSASTLSYH